MITLTANEICQACSGDLRAGTAAALVELVSTDTRSDLTSCLFIALKGDNSDGGDFAEEVLASGAMGVLAGRDAAEGLAAQVVGANVKAPGGTAGGGTVAGGGTGAGDLVRYVRGAEGVDPDDSERLQDPVVDAGADANRAAQALQAERMGGVSGGMDLSAFGLG